MSKDFKAMQLNQTQYVSYERAVQIVRERGDQEKLIRDCYLDSDVKLAGERFFSSEEFAATCEILGLKTSERQKSLLDIGCGNGIASYAFQKHGLKTFACDCNFSEEVGTGAAKKLSDQSVGAPFQILNANIESLPFQNASFDIVYSRQLLHHVTDLPTGLKECFRVLKPGGLLFTVREHVVESEEERQQFLLGHPLHHLHGCENAYSEAHYSNVIRGAGFILSRIFAPFDTVVNHFPISNIEVKGWMRQGLERRFGKQLGNYLSSWPLIEKLYRRKLSRSCAYPGRLFSFLSVKPK